MSGEGGLTHLDARGAARMVGVGHKPPVARRAVAEALVRMAPASARLMSEGGLPKGDAAAVARVAGIMAAKRTPELVALCHPLPIDRAAVDVAVDPAAGEVRIRAEVETTARTGVEMEALTAASVAALNVYDLVKGVDPAVVIERVRLVEKTTGDPAP
ncbi:cyclic pyranopterin monophosphate synthase MoaC [Miltoncostaea marina]|uniref:cyclic pyranopterin monophosphate synthase MoaC n=1 Tax=Miltoncostaea marina TaxID=2843215 RepID=UPI001C3C978B|nr:cyclic pyranopterin monophosphate synthase MoaC [Miltoncostaea marina]